MMVVNLLKKVLLLAMQKMIKEGVDIIDIGACSSKLTLLLKKEIEIIKKYTKLIQKFPKTKVSDTFRSSVEIYQK